MTPPSFRPMGPDDVATVLAMMRDYYLEDGHDFVEDRACAALDALAGGHPLAGLWLIEEDGASVGYLCVAYGFSLETGGGDFFLDEIFVHPARRGHGLGRAALHFAAEESRRLGARRIVLEVERANERARALYAGEGYELHHRQLMSKWL